MSSQWLVKFTPEGENDLTKLDKPVRRRVIIKLRWLEENFPWVIPEPLSNKWRGYFKLRAGDWRVIYEIDFANNQLVVHRVELRDKVYKIYKKRKRL